MLKRKENKSNKSLVILGSLFLISGLSLIVLTIHTTFKTKSEEDIALDNFYIEEKQIETTDDTTPEDVVEEKKDTPINYVAVLRIPKINLKRGLVDRDSKYNNIKYNIMIHKESDTPDKEGGNVILVAHSGTSGVAYFRNVDKLSLNDEIYLDYNNKTYSYKITNIYDIEKTGVVPIRKVTTKSTITLITCRHSTNKQIVVIAEIA
ncbi:MAG: sortase [Bacilli bacterium]|nr:sortase [Bacilli bacterium]